MSDVSEMLLPTSESRKPTGSCMIWATAAEVCAAVGTMPWAAKRVLARLVAQFSKVNGSPPARLVSRRMTRVATVAAVPLREFFWNVS